MKGDAATPGGCEGVGVGPPGGGSRAGRRLAAGDWRLMGRIELPSSASIDHASRPPQASSRTGLILFALLCLPGCGGTARVLVSVPRPAPGAAAEKALFLAAMGGGRDPGFRRKVLGGLVKAFLDSGRYGILSLEPGEERAESLENAFEGIAALDEKGVLVYRRWTSVKERRSFLETAQELARARGAEVLVLLEEASASLAERPHHVHSYLDGSASGQAAVVDPRAGTITSLARENVSASARAHYATAAQIRDHLASRLAESLARGLLYERRGSLVTLEEPVDGSLRRGIDLARRGEWAGAARAWEEEAAAGLHPAAAHHNIAVARRVLGDPEGARAHLQAALELDPKNARYRRALAEIAGAERP